MAFYFYTLYGLRLKSPVEIPLLLPATGEEVDVALRFRQEKKIRKYEQLTEQDEIYKTWGVADNGLPFLTIWAQPVRQSDYLVIRVNNGRQQFFYTVDKAGHEIEIEYEAGVRKTDIFTYLLGPVIGCVLRLREQVCLHASVVAVKGKALAFIGRKRAGKSSLLATFGDMGVPVLADDVAVLSFRDNNFWVSSGYPRMRLWKESIDRFPSLSVTTLERVLPHLEKYYVPLQKESQGKWCFHSAPLPLESVYFLEERNSENSLMTTTCTPTEAFLLLQQNTYAGYLVAPELRKKEFQFFGKLAKDGKVLKLDRPDELSRLPDACHLIINECHSGYYT